MSVVSGKNGHVDGAVGVGVWSISTSADLQKVFASNTSGLPVTLDGNVDWEGNYKAYGHTPVHLPGEAISFEGVIVPETNPPGSNDAQGVTGTGVVNQAVITIDIESGAPIEHTVNFEGNGALTFTNTIDETLDSAVPNPSSSIGCNVTIVDAVPDVPTEADIEDVRTITITLTSENPTYVTSNTSGVVKRLAGNIDANVAITVYNDTGVNLPSINNTAQELKVFVDATTFWHFKYVKWGEISGLEVNVETGDPVGATLNAQYSYMATTGTTTPTATAGQIDKPGATKVYP